MKTVRNACPRGRVPASRSSAHTPVAVLTVAHVLEQPGATLVITVPTLPPRGAAIAVRRLYFHSPHAIYRMYTKRCAVLLFHARAPCCTAAWCCYTAEGLNRHETAFQPTRASSSHEPARTKASSGEHTHYEHDCRSSGWHYSAHSPHHHTRAQHMARACDNEREPDERRKTTFSSDRLESVEYVARL